MSFLNQIEALFFMSYANEYDVLQLTSHYNYAEVRFASFLWQIRVDRPPFVMVAKITSGAN